MTSPQARINNLALKKQSVQPLAVTKTQNKKKSTSVEAGKKKRMLAKALQDKDSEIITKSSKMTNILKDKDSGIIPPQWKRTTSGPGPCSIFSNMMAKLG